MIITRPNYKLAYLIFAANGTIRLNKKTIGLWQLKGSKWNSSTTAPKLYTARVHFNRNSMVQLSNNNKIRLMLTVARNIPDAMLTKADNRS